MPTNTKPTNTADAETFTPGQQYVADFLPDTDDGEGEWIARMIDKGKVAVCPRCRFARLPKNPFDVDGLIAKKYPHVTEDTCEVCAFLPEAMRFCCLPASTAAGLHFAPGLLTEARTARALLLYRYWFDVCEAADAFVWAAMREGLHSAGIATEGADAPQEGGEA